MNQFDAAELQAWRFLHFKLGMHVVIDSSGRQLLIFDSHGNYTAHALSADHSASLVYAAHHHALLAGVPFSEATSIPPCSPALAWDEGYHAAECRGLSVPTTPYRTP